MVADAFAQALSGAPTLRDAPRAVADERAEATAAADAIFNTTAGVISALFTVSKSGVEIAQVGRARGLCERAHRGRRSVLMRARLLLSQPVVSQLASSATTTAEERLSAEREARKLRNAAKAGAPRCAREPHAPRRGGNARERERRSRAKAAELRRAERKERLAAAAGANEAARVKALEDRAQREAERKSASRRR